MRRLILSTALCMIMSAPMSAPAFSQDYSADTVLATVNGQSITLGHLIALAERLPTQYQDLDNGTLYNGMLDQLIDQAMVAQTVSAGPDTDSKRTKLVLDIERNAVLSNKVLASISTSEISDADLQAAYDARFGSFSPTTEYNASHILVTTKEAAEALIAELSGGAEFAELAKVHSTGPSGPAGGSLGWFGEGAMVPPFEAAVVALEVGAISAPVQTQFGWHVVKLNEKRATTPPSLVEVSEDLQNEIVERRIRDELERMRNEAAIEKLDVNVPASAIREQALLDD